MNKLFQGIGVIMLLSLSLLFSNCDKNDEDNGNHVASDNSFKIAYVKTDTLAEVYEYYNDLKTSLLLEQQEAEADLSSRYKSMQTKYLQIQRDLQDNMITPTSAQKKQEKLALDQQKWQQDQQRYEFELMEKNQKMTLEIYDSIQNYLKIYNKEYKFNMIIATDTLGSNLLYADKNLDITGDVIKALNKRYRAALGKQEGEEDTEEN
ncbi:MAG: OmpH family outer membrane protein [Bacteroidales bacterium]|nr:OmpH family outer membrane protein [Bacteroidales bacterium]